MISKARKDLSRVGSVKRGLFSHPALNGCVCGEIGAGGPHRASGTECYFVAILETDIVGQTIGGLFEGETILKLWDKQTLASRTRNPISFNNRVNFLRISTMCIALDVEISPHCAQVKGIRDSWSWWVFFPAKVAGPSQRWRGWIVIIVEKYTM